VPTAQRIQALRKRRTGSLHLRQVLLMPFPPPSVNPFDRLARDERLRYLNSITTTESAKTMSKDIKTIRNILIKELTGEADWSVDDLNNLFATINRQIDGTMEPVQATADFCLTYTVNLNFFDIPLNGQKPEDMDDDDILSAISDKKGLRGVAAELQHLIEDLSEDSEVVLYEAAEA
jgi:hypothetical protein